MTETYIELHARSAFSFLQGASLPEGLAQAAANLGYPAMALVDRDGFYGAPRFHLRPRKPASAHTSARRLPAPTDSNIRCWWKIAPAIRIFAASSRA
jgi:error-prone DNA polymerase